MMLCGSFELMLIVCVQDGRISKSVCVERFVVYLKAFVRSVSSGRA